MENTAYTRFVDDKLILRDELAIDRTLLANERTLLAYLRSAVSLIIAGVSIMHFAQPGWFFVVGVLCIPAGIITGIVGISRFLKMDRSLSVVRDKRNFSLALNAEASGNEDV